MLQWETPAYGPNWVTEDLKEGIRHNLAVSNGIIRKEEEKGEKEQGNGDGRRGGGRRGTPKALGGEGLTASRER